MRTNAPNDTATDERSALATHHADNTPTSLPRTDNSPRPSRTQLRAESRLVDLHTHVFHKITYWGIDPDPLAARTGVTTWNDAGSVGAMTLPGFRDFVVRPAKVGITAFLNISSVGLVCDDSECATPHYLDVDLFRRLVEHNSDLVLGVRREWGTWSPSWAMHWNRFGARAKQPTPASCRS